MPNLVVLERTARVGGTWRDNSYPGCACDVPPALYSISFELNPFGVAPSPADKSSADTIIFGTGFPVIDMPMATWIRGRDGHAWRGVVRWGAGASRYHGSRAPKPVHLVGPNTGLGYTTLIYMIESQVAYILDALRHLRRTGVAAMEVRPERRPAYERGVNGRCGARCGRPVDAPADTSMPAVTTPHSGRR